MFYNKFSLFILLIVALSPNVLLANQALGLESMVTCKQNDAAIQVAKKIQEHKGFKNAGGNFYTPTEKTKLFGFTIKYIGLLGVDMAPGPNITVEARFENVKEKILGSLENKFECGPGGCGSQVGNYQQIMLYSHPSDKNLTIIQCGYFGP